MAEKKQAATAPKKRRRTKSKSTGPRISIVRLVVALSLISFLLFTIGTVGYVIFFRTVIV